MKRKRVLISAYGCEPHKGSEQGVGWHWCLEMARIADIVVITRSNNRNAVQAALPKELADRVRFEFYDLPHAIQRFKRKERGLYFYYLLWQWGAYKHAKKLLDSIPFDYSMHLTFGSIWLPTFMHRLPLPFIWGPVGGGEAVPFSFISGLPPPGRIMQYLRYLLIVTLPINPLLAGVMRHSKVILARTGDTAKALPDRYAHKVKVVLETAIAQELYSTSILPIREDGTGVLQVIYTGRLIALKNVSVAILAVARAIDMGVKLRFLIFGGGPLRRKLETLSHRLGVNDSVEFRGVVSQAEAVEALRRSDVYLFPSLKEGGSWSLMEAMAVGLPAICVNASGMAVITDENSAIRVDACSQEQLVDGFTKAIVELARSPSRRKCLGEKARKRIEEEFQWTNKGDFMAALFEELENGEIEGK